MTEEKSNDDDRPFTPDERGLLRQMLLADSRRAWVVSTIMQISVWIASVGAAYLFLKDHIKDLFSNSGHA